MFPEVYAAAKLLLKAPGADGAEVDRPIILQAKISDYEGSAPGSGEEAAPRQVKLLVNEVKLLAEAQAQSDNSYILQVEPSRLATDRLKLLKDIIRRHPGPAPVLLSCVIDGAECRIKFGESFRVLPDQSFCRAIEEWRCG
jgi:DNA polymerase-3 subunit alpha